MSIRKLDNGKYLVQMCFTINGKRYRPSKTFNTRSECRIWKAEQQLHFKELVKRENEMTVREALDKYIRLSRGLSPTTLRTYNTIYQYGFKSIMDLNVWDLTDLIMKEAVIEESERCNIQHPERTISAKTVANEYALLSSALFTFTNKRYNVTLPKRKKMKRKYPTQEQILPYILGTDIEIACLMGLCSMRMSEVRGMRYCDIDGRYMNINQVKVYVGKDIVKEQAKTEDSIRSIKMPVYLQHKIQESHQGEYLVNQSSGYIYKRFKQLTKDSGFDITFHSLRHIFASTGALIGIKPLYLAQFGGWSGTKVMEENYQSVFDPEMAIAEDKICDYLDSNINKFVS